MLAAEEWHFDESGVSVHAFALPRLCEPGFCASCLPSSREGAGNAGCWPHPRALRAKKLHFYARKKSQGSRNTRHSLRNGFTAYTCSPRCAGLFGHRRPAKRPAGLDPSVGGSGPHDFAVRSGAFVSRARASIAARAYVRDDRDTPLHRRGMRRYNHNFPKNGSRIFLRNGVDISLTDFR
jgi:hypothetical protein